MDDPVCARLNDSVPFCGRSYREASAIEFGIHVAAGHFPFEMIEHRKILRRGLVSVPINDQSEAAFAEVLHPTGIGTNRKGRVRIMAATVHIEPARRTRLLDHLPADALD